MSIVPERSIELTNEFISKCYEVHSCAKIFSIIVSQETLFVLEWIDNNSSKVTAKSVLNLEQCYTTTISNRARFYKDGKLYLVDFGKVISISYEGSKEELDLPRLKNSTVKILGIEDDIFCLGFTHKGCFKLELINIQGEILHQLNYLYGYMSQFTKVNGEYYLIYGDRSSVFFEELFGNDNRIVFNCSISTEIGHLSRNGFPITSNVLSYSKDFLNYYFIADSEMNFDNKVKLFTPFLSVDDKGHTMISVNRNRIYFTVTKCQQITLYRYSLKNQNKSARSVIRIDD